MPVAPALSQDNIQNNNMQISAHGAWEKERHTNPFYYTEAMPIEIAV